MCNRLKMKRNMAEMRNGKLARMVESHAKNVRRILDITKQHTETYFLRINKA